MYITLNVTEKEELEIITVILINKIISKNEGAIPLTHVGIVNTINELNIILDDKENLGHLYSIIDHGYTREDIINYGKELLYNQRRLK